MQLEILKQRAIELEQINENDLTESQQKELDDISKEIELMELNKKL